jgi:hypothetical protein
MKQLIDSLNSSLGKDISKICNGKFHTQSDNHCAHYVSHILGLGFSYHCKEFKGGNGTPSNIRVHEIFEECPKVGSWASADLTKNLLVFVTKVDNVDLNNKKMRNVPQKHIGVFSHGFIYHYSNSQNKVVKWDPAEFLTKFDGIYSGKQGLFFGAFPDSDLELSIQSKASSVELGIGFDLQKKGNQWFAAPGGDINKSFYVGRRTSRGKYIGLFMKVDEYYGPTYSSADYIKKYDHWSILLELTGYCESKNRFNLINTYDSAKFTFGFFQLAAHTANDNLIVLFRALTQLSNFQKYFPELVMHHGRLHRKDEHGVMSDLEVESRTGPGRRRQLQKFMDFLNAKRFEHDMQEVLQCARVIHWANSDSEQRDLQVEVAFNILQSKMGNRYAKWYNLNGVSDTICALVADIHHQGRASKAKVRAALNSNDPMEKLISINPNYKGRANDLRWKIKDLTDKGQLGKKVYNSGLNEFE